MIGFFIQYIIWWNAGFIIEPSKIKEKIFKNFMCATENPYFHSVSHLLNKKVITPHMERDEKENLKKKLSLGKQAHSKI